MGNNVLQLDGDVLAVDGTKYTLIPGLEALILKNQPQRGEYNDNDLQVYELLVAQTKNRITPNKITGAAQPRATWKWKHVLKDMVIPD